MSSYFDDKTYRVSRASDEAGKCGADFIAAVVIIEQEVIRDVTLVAGDREFPDDLREKAMSIIANWHVGKQNGLEPVQKAVEYATFMQMSELVEKMHTLFHEVASRRIMTRFGRLSDNPPDILARRDEHDSEAIPSHIDNPKPEPGCDPLYGKRMDSADCGEN